MPEGLNEGGKILGMPRKVAIPVLGISVVVVAYVLLRRGSGAGNIPRAQPESGGDTGAIGGGGGGGGGFPSVTNAPPTNPVQEALDRLLFEREQFGYNIEQRKESERQREFEIGFEEQRSTLDKFLELLPFQLETQKQAEEARQAGYQAEEARGGYLEALFGRQAAEEAVIERSVKGKKKVECPPGMHLVVTPEGGAVCQPLGGGGFNFKTIFAGAGNALEAVTKGVTDVITGAGRGAARGVEAGAEQYARTYVGGIGSKRPAVGTPGISPKPLDAIPYQFSGSTEPSYPGLA